MRTEQEGDSPLPRGAFLTTLEDNETVLDSVHSVLCFDRDSGTLLFTPLIGQSRRPDKAQFVRFGPGTYLFAFALVAVCFCGVSDSVFVLAQSAGARRAAPAS
jgi:hypothetical protein